MLINEVLHKVKASRMSYLVLKLDTMKAFDCVSWAFLICLLIALGFGPNFIQLIQAINSGVTVSILI